MRGGKVLSDPPLEVRDQVCQHGVSAVGGDGRVNGQVQNGIALHITELNARPVFGEQRVQAGQFFIRQPRGCQNCGG